MNFTFTEEQRLLEDTVRRFVTRDYTFEKRRDIIASRSGWSRDVWRLFADLGLLALNVPEEHGGLNAGPVETMLVMNALGHGIVVEPYLASAVLSTGRQVSPPSFEMSTLHRSVLGALPRLLVYQR